MSNEQLLREFIEQIWNQQRKDLVMKYVAPAYKIQLDPGDPWEGKVLDHQEFKNRLDFSFLSFPDLHFLITSCIEDESHVAITWILTGTNLGKIGNIPPTNKPIKSHGITIYHFAEGLICGHTQVFDRSSVARQLGFNQN